MIFRRNKCLNCKWCYCTELTAFIFRSRPSFRSKRLLPVLTTYKNEGKDLYWDCVTKVSEVSYYKFRERFLPSLFVKFVYQTVPNWRIVLNTGLVSPVLFRVAVLYNWRTAVNSFFRSYLPVHGDEFKHKILKVTY